MITSYLFSGITVLITAMVLFRPNGARPSPAVLWIVGTPILLIVVAMFIVAIWFRRNEPFDAEDGDGTSDRFWKWGLIYYNPNDPALIVPTRMGWNIDLNWGNRRAWLLAGAILGAPLLWLLFRSLI